jgi:hypothetical protein
VASGSFYIYGTRKTAIHKHQHPIKNSISSPPRDSPFKNSYPNEPQTYLRRLEPIATVNSHGADCPLFLLLPRPCIVWRWSVTGFPAGAKQIALFITTAAVALKITWFTTSMLCSGPGSSFSLVIRDTIFRIVYRVHYAG